MMNERSRQEQSNSPRYWGKYRGKVVANTDPKGLGRITVRVGGVTGDLPLQALPCTPYAGPQVGFLMLPPVGANVWVEFENGNINVPIWSGCFWGDGRQDDTKPPNAATSPDVKVLQTEKLMLTLDDQQECLTAKLKEKTSQDNEQTMSITMDKSAIVLTAQQVTITITPDSIRLVHENATIEVTDKITLAIPPATLEIAENMTLTVSASTAELSQAGINLKNGAASVAMDASSINLNNGALEVV